MRRLVVFAAVVLGSAAARAQEGHAEGTPPPAAAEAAPAAAEAAPEAASPAPAGEAKADDAKPTDGESAQAKPAEAAKPDEAAQPAEAAAPEAAPGEGAHAEAAAPAHGEGAVHAQGGAPAEGAHAEPHGIVNWWSWDYGPSAKDPSHRDWPPPFGFALLNFAVFLLIIGRLAIRPLRTMARERHARIRAELDEAKRLRDEAAARLAEYEALVRHADDDVQKLLAALRREADGEKARIIAAAEEQAARIKADAERQITAEIARARAELRQSVVESAVALAEQLVRKQVGADDQRRLAERFVSDLEAGSHPEKAR